VTVAATVAIVFGVVIFNVFLVQSQFQLERLDAEVTAERAEYERLRLEAARLSSPERILDLARGRLGMVEPQTITYLTAPAAAPEADGGQAVLDWAEVKPILAAE
jgi:cell division protein FtsL